MYENFRLFFSVVWLIATGCLVATGFASLVTWGGFLRYFFISAVVWMIASIGAITTAR